MEDNFYLDDFELSLKEQADQFKMAPSKKVWHGIYNDMHPGRRWPSITISLLLVISTVFVGYINTHNDKVLVQDEKVLVQAKKENTAKNDNINTELTRSTNEKFAIAKKAGESKNIAGINSEKSIHDLDVVPFDEFNSKNNSLQPATILPALIENSNQPKAYDNKVVRTNLSGRSEDIQIRPAADGSTNVDAISETHFSNSLDITADNVATQPKLSKLTGNNNITSYKRLVANGFEVRTIERSILSVNEIKIIPISVLDNKGADHTISTNETQKDNRVLLSANVVIPTEHELSIKKARQKQRNKTTWLFYAGPSLNTVYFSGNHLTESNNQNPVALPQVTQKDNRVMHNSAIGFEAGVQMNYLFAKKLEFTAGTHFTRSGYDIVSNEVHPTLTTLVLKDKATGDHYSRNFVTHYGDGNGQSTNTLRNYSYEVSLPVGVQYQLFGNNKVQFNLGVNVEPSLVLKSNSYILSSDGRNYVNVPDLYRRWNLNSNFTPFITFRSNKLKWILGPVIRYQWLSSYSDDYTIKEHLINYGIRLGISK